MLIHSNLFLVIFPVDYDSTQDIIDDVGELQFLVEHNLIIIIMIQELHEELVAPLPPGCRLTVS